MLCFHHSPFFLLSFSRFSTPVAFSTFLLSLLTLPHIFHLCITITLSHLSPYFSSFIIPTLSSSPSFTVTALSLSLHSLFPFSPPLSNTLSLSLSIIHSAVTVGVKGPRNIAPARTQQKQPHWIMGNWVTSQEREGAGGAAEGGRCHRQTHLIVVLQSRRTGKEKVMRGGKTVKRQWGWDRSDQWSRSKMIPKQILWHHQVI